MTSEKRAAKWWDEQYITAGGIETVIEMLNAHAAEQREACADAANSALADLNLLPSEKAIVILAVAKAQEKGDE